jgi:branched-chain amino acid transport system permease protein
LAGLAGFLFAVKDGFVNPEMMSWHLSGSVLIMIILGGLGHLRGALIGAFAFALLQEFFKSEAIFGAFAKHWHLGLGLTIIASVALLPRGLVRTCPRQWKERLAGRSSRRAETSEAQDDNACTTHGGDVLLRGRDITRRWAAWWP